MLKTRFFSKFQGIAVGLSIPHDLTFVCRYHKEMKHLMKHRATFYMFMKNLKVSVIEDGVTRVLQVNSGTTTESKHLSAAQKEFKEAFEEVIANYKDDKLSSHQLLEAAATKFDSWKIHRAFNSFPTQERNIAELEEAAEFNPRTHEAEVNEESDFEDGPAGEDSLALLSCIAFAFELLLPSLLASPIDPVLLLHSILCTVQEKR